MFPPPTALNAIHSITIFNMLRAPRYILFWTNNTAPLYKLRFYDTVKESFRYTYEMYFYKILVLEPSSIYRLLWLQTSGALTCN